MCVFCKIINKEQSADIVCENEEFIAFKDINPVSPVHILIVPKKHIASVIELQPQDKELAGGLILFAQKIAKDNNLSGYKLTFNVGREGGQIIDHLHLHLIGNK